MPTTTEEGGVEVNEQNILFLYHTLKDTVLQGSPVDGA